MKKILALLLCAVMMILATGCSVDFVAEYEIVEVIVHTSVISSIKHRLDEGKEINAFFNKFKILDADFIYTAEDDFDPATEFFIGGDAAEIEVSLNNGETLMFYVTKNGTVYRKSSTETVHTESGVVTYDKMTTFLDNNFLTR
jgi:hypothetical protein